MKHKEAWVAKLQGTLLRVQDYKKSNFHVIILNVWALKGLSTVDGIIIITIIIIIII